MMSWACRNYKGPFSISASPWKVALIFELCGVSVARYPVVDHNPIVVLQRGRVKIRDWTFACATQT
jgi:hypothetical protein